MTAKISSPRKGSELDARVFARWQEQVTRAIREVRSETFEVDFGTLGPNGQSLVVVALDGAIVGAAVVVTPVEGQPFGLIFDGYVTMNNWVSLRAVNLGGGAINTVETMYRVEASNPTPSPTQGRPFV